MKRKPLLALSFFLSVLGLCWGMPGAVARVTDYRWLVVKTWHALQLASILEPASSPKSGAIAEHRAARATTTLSGSVFEDPNYGGGAGRPRATAGTTPVANATVELYDGTGAYQSSATTDGAGAYSFGVQEGDTYTVRVVNQTVGSNRPGYVTGLLSVQTYNGAPNHVGGEAPEKADATAGGSGITLSALTTAATAPQSQARLTIATGGVSDVDFGFNFDLIVNASDAGQGSLRQFILNANALGGEVALAQAGRYATQTDLAVGASPATVALPAGRETSIFMIADGRAHPGLRAGLTNQLSPQGVAVIAPLSYLGDITGAETSFNGLTQTYNIGNTNDVLLGTGGTVGVDNVALSRLNGPEVRLQGNPGIGGGLRFYYVPNAEIKGLNLYGFGGGTNSDVSAALFFNNCTGPRVEQNVLAPSASSFGTDPGAGNRGNSDHIGLRASLDLVMTNNLIAFAEGHGLQLIPGSNNAMVTNNEFVGNGQDAGFPFLDNIAVRAGSITARGNRLAAAGAKGFDNFDGPGNNCNIVNNTVEGNGQLQAETQGIGLRQTVGWSVTRNIIRNNIGSGIIVLGGNQVSASTDIAISQNSIYGNGQVAGKETGAVGIDLQTDADANGLIGNAPYVTLNDDGDADAGANDVRNFPVLTEATVRGSNLVLSGFVSSGTLVEFFVARPNTVASGSILGNNFGQGKTFLFDRREGSGQDLDGGVGSYGQGGAAVNGFFQGTETNQSRFRFTVPLSSLTVAQQAELVASGRLTATGTLGGRTSEFGGNVVVGVPLVGVVFEDVNYGGGAGRGLAASAGVPRPGAAVELYDNAGAFVNSVTTDAGGAYGFSVPAGTYTVRVVGGSVSSSRPGYVAGLLPVQTFVNGDVNRVGGEAPEKADAPANPGSQTLASLGTATTTAQSLASVTVGAGGVSGVDFGFNFDLVVNANDAGPGSLRQFVLNSNALGGEGSLAQNGSYANQIDLPVGTAAGSIPRVALPAGTETSIFMIPAGAAVPGLRAGLANQLTNGVAVIQPAADLAGLTGPATAVNGLTQTYNVGNTNDVLLGTGGTVGTGATALSRLNGPEVQLIGGSTSSVGLDVASSALNVGIYGLAMYGFGPGGAYNYALLTANIRLGADGAIVSQNVLGASATIFGDPGSGARSRYDNVAVMSGSARIANNLIGFAGGRGVLVAPAVGGTIINNNEFRDNAVTQNYLDGVDVQGGTATITGNLAANNGGVGFDTYASSGGNVISGNTVTGNGRSNSGNPPDETPGIRLFGAGNTVAQNIIADNYGAGVLVTANASTSRISQNSIFNNGTAPALDGTAASGEAGIDLQAPGENQGQGTAPYATLNDDGDADMGGNGLLNYPVLETATVSGGNLTLSGFATPGALLEVFVAAPNALPSGNTTANDFGQGRVLLFTATEGAVQDQDATTGSYGQGGAVVNGFSQGTETGQNRFRYAVPVSSLTAAQQATLTGPGVKLTATATLGGATSEFSGNVVLGVLLAGVVFEDVNYGGGAGRSQFASAGVPVGTAGNPATAATVELYDNAGALVASTRTSTTIGTLGRYEFSVPAGSYTVRVVSSTVSSARPGTVAGLLPVQTFNSAPDRVGGEAPEKADAPANTGSQPLASLTTATATAQCLAGVAVSASGVNGVDFGFNFDVVVNTNDAGPGSLRQFLFNSNALGNAGLAQAGQAVGQEVSLFMVPDGAAHPGLRAGLVSGLTNGVAVIKPLSALPAITDAGTSVDGTTQTRNVGDTNGGLLGTGGFVGTGPNGVAEGGGDDLVLDRVGRPEVQLEPGVPYQSPGLDVQAANAALRGLAVLGFGTVISNTDGVNVRVGSVVGFVVEDNFLGLSATKADFASGGATTSPSFNIVLAGTGNGTASGVGVGLVQRNLIGYVNSSGITTRSGAAGVVIRDNEIRNNVIGTANLDAIDLFEALNMVVTGNLIADNDGAGVNNFGSAGGHVVRGNTITGNGQAGNEMSGVRLFGQNNTLSQNIIRGNYGAGIQVTTDSDHNTFSRNAIAGNGSATGQVGIDLQAPSDNGSAPFSTLNDVGDADTGGNGLLNFPVLATATVRGGEVVLTGFASAGAEVELFLADPDPSGFGEGNSYLGTFVEGSTQDTDPGTGSYGPGPVNGLAQGQDNANRFAFRLSLSSLPAAQQAALQAAGALLTATATLAGNTSEFSGNVAVGVPLAGVVFEDVNYGGGAGRSRAASAGVPRPGAAVELYDNTGRFVNSTTTDAVGAYSFSVPAGNYTVRVVSGTVSSSRPGYVAGLLPVPTYNGTTGRVGGQAPEKVDAPANAGSQPLAGLTTAATTAQAVAAVTVSGTGLTAGPDFGFNFDLVVNTRDADQGSLRQFILNSNALGGESSLAQAGSYTDLVSGVTTPLPAGQETSVFMISDGQAHPGLGAGLANQLSAQGVAVIYPSAPLLLTGANAAVDGRTQTFNVGNTNNVTLGTGGTVGVNNTPLAQLNGPEVQVQGNRGYDGLQSGADASATSDGVTFAGVAVYGFQKGIVLFGRSNTVTQAVVGTPATTFTDPGPGNRTANYNIEVLGAPNRLARITSNLIGFAGRAGISQDGNTSDLLVTGNEIAGNSRETDALDGMDGSGGGVTVTGNLVRDNSGMGYDGFGSEGKAPHTITGNTFRSNGNTNNSAFSETVSLRVLASGSVVRENIISGGVGAGVLVGEQTQNVTISRNSIFGNGSATGEVGIDLQASGENQIQGTAPYVTFNDDGDADVGGNNLLNYPVLRAAQVQGGNLVLTGFAPAGALLEFFIAQPNALAAGSTEGNNFGQGKAYLLTQTEGGAQDQDATTGSYGQAGTLVNGFFQGTETNQQRFRFSVPLGSLSPAQQVALQAAGAQLTATATLGGTSEFAGNVPVVPTAEISGVVFEDANYGGGAGRSLSAAGGVPRPGATVELYTNGGALVASTTTDAAGQYRLNSGIGSYTVRVVSSTVSSARPGTVAGLLPVQTFNSAPDRVGGEAPEKADAPANTGSQPLASLTTATATAQCLAGVAVSASGVNGVDFGFNFDVVVNTNDAGPGSLRQFLFNSNALGNAGLAQAGQAVGQEVSLFMVPDGAAHPGLRSGVASGLTNGVVLITPATVLPIITDARTSIDGTTQTTNIGDTNAGVLGMGGHVGTGPNGVVESSGTTDDAVLSQVARPEVQLQGAATLATGLDVRADGATLRGLSVLGFGSNPNNDANVNVFIVAGLRIEANFLGLSASTANFATSTTATGSGFNLLITRGSGDGTATGTAASLVQNNLIGYSNSAGIGVSTSTTGVVIRNNEIRSNAIGSPYFDGIDINGGSNTVVTGNLLVDNGGGGVDSNGSLGGNVLTNNTVAGNGWGNVETAGVRLFGTGSTVSQNIIRDNYGAGIMGTANSANNTFSRNAISGNGTATTAAGGAASGQVGIDLLTSTDNAEKGTAPYVTFNDADDADAGANGLLNFPVLESASVVGANLEVRGFARPGTLVELFVVAPDPSGFGEGQTYLASRAEGSAGDADAGAGSYSGLINGLNQGSDNTNRFAFSIPLGSLPAAQQATLNACGARLTATATLSGATSEFSGNVTIAPSPVTIRVTGSVPVCAGGTVRLSTGPRTGFLFTWFNGTTVVNGPGSVLNDSVFVASAAGSYTVQLTPVGCAGASTTSPAVTLTVLPAVVAGTIAADQTVCPGATPAPLTGPAASGGTGTYAYQWESSLNNTTWTTLAGATSPSYAPGPVSATTYFRRQATSGTCVAVPSNAVTLTVLPAVVAGTIAADQTVCPGATPAPLTGPAASGGTGTYTYQWESSLDNTTWAAVAGATGTGYAPGPVSATTYFRRQATSGTGTCATVYTAAVTITVLPTLTPGTIGASQSLCAGLTPAPLTSSAGAGGGTGTYAYQWESSLDNATWAAIAGATNATYAPGPLSATTYFRRQVTSGAGPCAAAASNVVTLTVTPGLLAGTIGADQTVCPGATPAPLTGPAASGGTGTYTYQWESSLDNTTWAAISGATAASYAPGPVSATTYFRRRVTSGTGTCATVYTAAVTITVLPALAAGTIAADQTVCPGATPAPLTGPAASGGTGTYTYQWEASFDNTTWAAIAGATTVGYAPGPVTATTSFRRQVTSGTGTCGVGYSNAVTLTVTPALAAGTVSADQVLCAGAAPAPLTGPAASGGTGTYMYQWESSLDNVTWAAIAGATGLGYTPGPLVTTTYFRRRAASGTCAAVPSNAVALTVLPAVAAGTVSADQVLCAGAAPAPLTGPAASGGAGTYTYQWEASFDNATWTAISGATGLGYTPGPLAATTYFRRRAASGTCAAAVSNIITLTVTPALAAGDIASSQNLCAGAAPAPLTGPAASGGTGTYTYQWESSLNNVTWTAISGATGLGYTPGPVTATTSFRRQVISGTCAGATSNAVTLTVTPGVTPGSIAASQSLCAGAVPAAFTSQTGAGGGIGAYSYQWESSLDNVTWTAIGGATAATYAPGPVNVATSFRRQATSGTGTCGVAYSNVVSLTVTPGLAAGTIGTSQTLCPGATPAPLTGPAASGGTGTYTYQWESSLDNTTWAAVAGATGTGYAPGPVSATTYFRRQATSGTGTCATAASNVVTFTVAPALAAGSIAASQSLCANTTPAPLTGTAASGGTGTYAYQWESSPNTTTWVAISGATGADYAPGPVAATTHFRRRVTSGTGTCAVAYTGTVTLTVLPAVAAGSIGANQSLCANATPARLTSLTGASGGTGTYAYQWESSTNNTTWSDVTGATASEYAPGPLAATTYFRRRVTSGTGTCAVAYTAEIAITVTPALTAGTVGSNQTVCANTTPALLTGPPATGGTGTYTYQWQSSLDNTTWVALASATGLSYAPGPVTATTYFRRQATSGTGTCATATSNVVTLTATPAQAAGVSLTSPPPQCAGSALTFTPVVTNGGPAPTFRWFVNNVLAAVTPTFTTATLADNDQVRVELTPTPGACLTGTPAATAVVRVVAPVMPAVTVRALGTGGPACAGTVLSFGLDNATGAGLAPQYQWLLNGVPVPGSTGPTFASAALRDNDRLRLQLTSSASCASPAVVTSNELVIILRPDVLPTVSIAGPGATCTGTAAAFSVASSTALGTAPTYQWRVDGLDVSGATGATFSSATLRDGQLVTLAVRTLTATCNQPATAVSNAVRATVIPVVDVDAGPDKEIAEGESVVLEGTANGTYPVEWTPTLGLSFAAGNPLRPVASPTATTVYTLRANLNGCQDESRVTVKVGPPIRIPNAFSPNGDGINDTWQIDRIGNFPGNTVRVYNRWGSQIFSASDYSRATEWNGTSQGRALPVGTYYYVITLGNGKSYSGPITVVY